MAVVVGDLDVGVGGYCCFGCCGSFGGFWCCGNGASCSGKHLFVAQLIVAFVMLMVVWVDIVDLAVMVVTLVLVAGAMASLALAK
eukprot:11472150-Ditylum_brightwellii.AAC.1